jgi:sterol desaturase/sphingolipid hydroxylase (fatty acid hydroxylase superfamily)
VTEKRPVVYSVWLFGLSLFFVLVERLWPRKSQRLLRRGIWNDAFYLIFNSEYLGVLIGIVSIHAIAALDASLDLGGLRKNFYLGVMSAKSPWLQFAVLLIAFDLAQWLIHNLLHRVPWLWSMHKIHHSIEEMDWIGNWRFHWGEVVVYKALLYAPAAFLGFSASTMFWYGVLSTLIGHFAHSNVRLNLGSLKYIINSPEMHIWHHAHPQSGPVNRNFGITLSVWDWMFGTAHVPEGKSPERLGFEGIETFPRNVVSHAIWPFLHR